MKRRMKIVTAVAIGAQVLASTTLCADDRRWEESSFNLTELPDQVNDDGTVYPFDEDLVMWRISSDGTWWGGGVKIGGVARPFRVRKVGAVWTADLVFGFAGLPGDAEGTSTTGDGLMTGYATTRAPQLNS